MNECFHISILKEYLNKYDINEVFRYGDTLLHQAALRDCYQCIEYLLERGADTELYNYKNETAIQVYTGNFNDTRVLKLLLDAGATRNLFEALVRASNKKATNVAALLIDYGTEFNVQCFPNWVGDIATKRSLILDSCVVMLRCKNKWINRDVAKLLTEHLWTRRLEQKIKP